MERGARAFQLIVNEKVLDEVYREVRTADDGDVTLSYMPGSTCEGVLIFHW